MVFGCGGHATVGADGTFRMAVRAEGPCEVRGRADNATFRPLAVSVEPTTDSETRVALSALPKVVLDPFAPEVRESRAGLEVVEGASNGLVTSGDVFLSLDGTRLRPRRDPLARLAEAAELPSCP